LEVEVYLIWNRFKYVLSPQFDIYTVVKDAVRNKVADIGFGTGFGTHLFNVNAKEVYGFEIDENAIQFAKSVFPFKNLHFEYGDIEKGIDGQVFNYIVMIDVIEHLKQDKVALDNVKKMMSKDGTFICSTPNRLSRYRKGESHVKEFAPKELEGVLKRHFVSVKICNYRLEPLASQYENPLLAVCRNDETVPQSTKGRSSG
jgi:2-polyprenyl-3-methyl-5-hydroxy-6-metoxy-1,4-benzoquinol methylase